MKPFILLAMPKIVISGDGSKKLVKTIDFYAFCFAKEKTSSIFARTFTKGMQRPTLRRISIKTPSLKVN